MVICPKCNIEYDEGKRFCKKCGSFLLSTEEEFPYPCERGESVGEPAAKGKLICPKCQDIYEIGNYCRKCGLLLIRQAASQEFGPQPLEKESIKKRSIQWMRLSKEKKKLKVCLDNLEMHQDKISNQMHHAMRTRYQEQLESLSSLQRKIEIELESVKKTASEEMEKLQKELQPILKGFAEIQSLYQLGAMTKADFSKERNKMMEEIGSRERSLKKYRNILSVLPNQLGGGMTSLVVPSRFLRPIPLMIMAGFILLAVVLSRLLWQASSSSDTPFSSPVAPLFAEVPSSEKQPEVSISDDTEKIMSLFEAIRQANIEKNITLLMSCYSHNFKDKEGKRIAALETWANFNYLDLSYRLQRRVVTGDTAEVRVEWLIRTSPKTGGKPQDTKSVLNVILSREQGNWKITDIQSAS